MVISHLVANGVDKCAETFDLDLGVVDTQLVEAEASDRSSATRPDGVPREESAFAAAGADRCLLPLAHLDTSQTLAALDDWARLIPA